MSNPTPNQIIAICGPRGSGKSTLANSLASKDKYRLLSFAHPIKKMLVDLVVLQGCTYEDAIRMFYGDLKNTPSEYLGGRTPVYAMQTLGTEWGRDMMHVDLWVNAWFRKAERLIEKYDVVVDDLRFLSEERVIRSFEKSTIVRIERDGYTSGDHQSEKEFQLIKPDFTVSNVSNPEQMYNDLKWYMS